MDKRFTASEVRQFRVVPKGWAWTDVKDDEIWASVTAHPESYETRILYTHPSPSDTERLAEALRNLVEASHYADAPDEHEAAEAALAAHSAQAQPQAASVLDAMQELADKYHELLLAVARKFPGETRHETALRYIREAECQEAALAAQENPNA